MKITKYGHACILFEKDGLRLLVDPGSFTELPNNLQEVDFIIVTEEHYDHFNMDNLKKAASIKSARIYTTTSVAESLKESGMSVKAISGDQTIDLGSFRVEFSENDHATVYKKSPCRSLAILIDDGVYYPSDTYVTIKKKIKVLALPTSGPWFKVSECIEFVNAIDSEIVLTTHNALNSEIGNKVTNTFIINNISNDRKFVHLNNGESLDI